MALSSSNSGTARTPLRAQNAEVYYSDAAIVTADDSVIAEFREQYPSDLALIETVSWASLTAARALGARLPVELAAL